MEGILSGLVQMGSLGIMLAYMMYKESKTTEAHRTERSDWHQSSQQRHDEVKKLVEHNTAALVGHTSAMEKLSDKVEHNRCKAA